MKSKRLKKRLVVFHSLLASAIALASVLFVFLDDIKRALPDISGADTFIADESVVIYDREQNELYRLFDEEDRISVALNDLPTHIPRAFIAIEDERFYARSCLDVRALLRAALANVREYKSQGASTITQQLIRNALLKNEKTFERKIREIMLACALEKRMTKDEILETYLNWIPFGGNIYGIEQAAKRYFDVPADKLSIAQAAALAALPQRPTYFNPYGKNRNSTLPRRQRKKIAEGSLLPEKADVTTGLLPDTARTPEGVVRVAGRSDAVLNSMLSLGFIDESEYEAAQAELLSLKFRPNKTSIYAAHFVQWIREQDKQQPLKESGSIRTTIDPQLQQLAYDTVNNHAERVKSDYGARNIALLAVDRRTREILAYVGNTSFFDEEIDGQIDLIQAPRQPGSSFKPFVYAGAFLQGLQPDSIVYDLPLTIGTSKPKNFDGGFFGKMSMESALGRSRNIPAIKAFYWAGGEESVLNIASSMGIGHPLVQKNTSKHGLEYGWPLALGTAEAPLYEMVQGYATLANKGKFAPLKSVASVNQNIGEVQTVPEKIALELTDILRNPEARPPNAWRTMLSLDNRWAAVKTGTSNVCLHTEDGPCAEIAAGNLWTMGYTEDLVTGVLVTNADNTPLLSDANGLEGASPIWKEFMQKAHEILPDVKSNQ